MTQVDTKATAYTADEEKRRHTERGLLTPTPYDIDDEECWEQKQEPQQLRMKEGHSATSFLSASCLACSSSHAKWKAFVCS